jgi:hypothetical protein
MDLLLVSPEDKYEFLTSDVIKHAKDAYQVMFLAYLNAVCKAKAAGKAQKLLR